MNGWKSYSVRQAKRIKTQTLNHAAMQMHAACAVKNVKTGSVNEGNQATTYH